MRRLRLEGIHICSRCGRGRGDLVGEHGERLRVQLDAWHARELSIGDRDDDDVKALPSLVLAQLIADGATPNEIVFDVEDGVLRALLSFTHDDEPDVVACSPQEGIGFAVSGGLKLYATEEALEHAATEPEAHDDDSAH